MIDEYIDRCLKLTPEETLNEIEEMAKFLYEGMDDEARKMNRLYVEKEVGG